MANVQKYLNHLLQNTGITPACSEEERAASDLIAEVFRNHGFDPEVQEFSASAGVRNSRAALGVVLFVGAVLMGLGGIVGAIGFILALVVAVVYVMERTGRPVISRFGSSGLSQNVIAYHKAEGPLASPRNRPVVVVAHYDSPRVDFLAQPSYGSQRALIMKALPYAMVAPAVIAVVRLLPVPGALKVVLWLVAIVVAAIPLIYAVSIIASRFVEPYASGAVCNKSSVAALLGVMDAVSPYQGEVEFPRDKPFDEYMAEQERYAASVAQPQQPAEGRDDYGDGPYIPYGEDQDELGYEPSAIPAQEGDAAEDAYDGEEAYGAGDAAETDAAPEDEGAPATEQPAAVYEGETDAVEDQPIDVEAVEESSEPVSPAVEEDDVAASRTEEAVSEAPVEDEGPKLPINAQGNIRYGADAIHALGMVPAACEIEYTADAMEPPAPTPAPAAEPAPAVPAPKPESVAAVTPAVEPASVPEPTVHPSSIAPIGGGRRAVKRLFDSVREGVQEVVSTAGEETAPEPVENVAPVSGDVDTSEHVQEPSAERIAAPVPTETATMPPVEKAAESAPSPVAEPQPVRPPTRVFNPARASRRPAGSTTQIPAPPAVVPPTPVEAVESEVAGALGSFSLDRVSELAASASSKIKGFLHNAGGSLSHLFSEMTEPVEDEGDDSVETQDGAPVPTASEDHGAQPLDATVVTAPLGDSAAEGGQDDSVAGLEKTQVAAPVDPTVANTVVTPALDGTAVYHPVDDETPADDVPETSPDAPVAPEQAADEALEPQSDSGEGGSDEAAAPIDTAAPGSTVNMVAPTPVEGTQAVPPVSAGEGTRTMAIPAMPPSPQPPVDTVDSLMAEISSAVAPAPAAPTPSKGQTAVVRQIPPVIPDMPHLQQPAPANRTALFDLPDPSVKPTDPFAPEAPSPSTTSASRRGFSVVDPSTVPSISAPAPAAAPAAPVTPAVPVADKIETISAPADEKPAKRGLGRLFGRKKKDRDSMSDWLGVDEDFDAKRSGGEIGSWDNFEDDDSWKGGATGAEDATPEELRDAITSMGDDELLGHDIWFVATGASELGNAGIKAFLASHRDKLRGVFLINLECVGSGALAMLGTEGEERVLKGDRRIMNLVSRVASDFHIDIATVDMPVVDTDAHGAMEMSLRALTIAGVDGSTLACSHSADDQPFNVEPQNVAKVADIVTEVIRRS